MKIFFFILLIVFPFLLNAQSTTPGITQKSIGGYTFLVHTPIGYTPGQLVNVMVGAPGDGETNGPIAKDTINGSFARWNGKPGIRDTTSNATLDANLVVLWWNPGVTAPVPSQVQTILTAIKDTFNVYKIGVMGLSMGAQDWGQFAYYQKSNFDQIAAWFIASPEPVNSTPSPTFGGGPIPKAWWALDSVYWHAACATADPDAFFPPTKKTRDSVQASGDFRQPILDSSSCACHSSTVWGPMFSPYVNQTRTGMSIYKEFMAQYPIVTGTVADPTFSLSSGTYSSTQFVSLSSSTSGATIYYTTDGTQPNTSSSVYSIAITVASNQVIHALAVKSGFTNSEIVSNYYSINTSPSIYYVSSSSGSDANNGLDSIHPFLTITKANSVAGSGSTILLKGGDLFLQTLYPKTGITYDSYSPQLGPWIISGLYSLTGGTDIGNNVREFFVPAIKRNTNMLLYNLVPQQVVSYPDTDILIYTSDASNSISGTSMGSLPFNFANTGAYAMIQTDYYIKDTATITAQTSTQLTFASNLSLTGGRGNGYIIMNDGRLMASTNIIGRWFNNYSVDSVKVKLPPGGLGSNTLAVPILDTLVYCSSDSDITINGGMFIGSNQYSVFMNNAKRIKFNGTIFKYGAGNAITANNASFTQFNNCTFKYFQNNVAVFTGSSSTHNIVANCTTDSIGLWNGMGHGGATGSQGYSGWSNIAGSFNTWHNNTWQHIGYLAIAFSGDSCNIYNEYISRFCLLKVDGGGIYSWAGSFPNYTYGDTIKNCVVDSGSYITSGIVYDSTDQSFDYYFDGHIKSQVLIGGSGASSKSGGVLVHGSSITINGTKFSNHGYCDICVQEFSGTPITGLSINGVTTSNNIGAYSLVMTTPSNDLASFGVSDNNSFNNTFGTPIFTKSSTDGGTKRSLSNWQANSLYEFHSTYSGNNSKIFYNSNNSLGKQVIPGRFTDVNGVVYFGTLTLNGLDSKLLYSNNASNTIYIVQPFQISN